MGLKIPALARVFIGWEFVGKEVGADDVLGGAAFEATEEETLDWTSSAGEEVDTMVGAGEAIVWMRTWSTAQGMHARGCESECGRCRGSKPAEEGVDPKRDKFEWKVPGSKKDTRLDKEAGVAEGFPTKGKLVSSKITCREIKTRWVVRLRQRKPLWDELYPIKTHGVVFGANLWET